MGAYEDVQTVFFDHRIGYSTRDGLFKLRWTGCGARSHPGILLIISEAVKALGPDVTDHHRDVEWRAIRDIDNVLRHEYFEIDTRVIWRIVVERLPQLHHIVKEMIAEETRSQG